MKAQPVLKFPCRKTRQSIQWIRYRITKEFFADIVYKVGTWPLFRCQWTRKMQWYMHSKAIPVRWIHLVDWATLSFCTCINNVCYASKNLRLEIYWDYCNNALPYCTLITISLYLNLSNTWPNTTLSLYADRLRNRNQFNYLSDLRRTLTKPISIIGLKVHWYTTKICY